MLRSAYKHFSCLNLAEVTSKNDSKPFKVAPVDGSSVVVTVLACQSEGWGIDMRWTRWTNIR